MLKKILFSVMFMFFVVIVYFISIHLVVYGRNYDAVITNSIIILNKPSCISSFLSVDRLKGKYSYSLYKWINANEVDPATYHGSKGKTVFVPDYLWGGYKGKNIEDINVRLSCEFIIEDPNDPFEVYYQYKYKRDYLFLGGLGDRKVEIFIKLDDGKILDVYSRVFWEY